MNNAENQALITQFYTSFAKADVQGMIDCYHDQIVFEDPAFGVLKGDRAKNMWKMLISRGDGETKIIFDNVSATEKEGQANWQATYNYGEKKRKVINNIAARFEFQGGKIIKHTDTFDLWKWSKQALGVSGYLLGWSNFFKKKMHKTTSGLLDDFMNKK